MRNAHRVVKILGTTIIEVFSKVVGLLIAAIGIEYILGGITAWLSTHGAGLAITVL
jgi:small neutral amino acid transporter SnatA (MarC family)